MPLVQPGSREPPASARQRRARKIKPQYAEGKLVKVARATNQPEAEFIEGLLLEEGIPCMLRRSAGFDVAESLAAGPRDVLVPESGAEAAREALAWEGRPGDAGEAG
jgi:Putative prokaryotic signal transducing protein